MKKTIFIILTIILSNTPQALFANENNTLEINQKHKDSETFVDNRYNIGSIIISTTATLAAAFILDSFIKSQMPQEEEHFGIQGQHMVFITGIVTAGAVWAETINSEEKIRNPNQKILILKQSHHKKT